MNKCDSLKIFEELTRIPRPSGKEEKVVEYLVKFANDNNLKYELCGCNNVIIYKKSNIKGNNKTLILQGHIDMVCEKSTTSNINFEKDPIELVYDGDILSANGTTLGADNGVGVAIILHILKSNNIKHPNIEAVFTAEEESTMNGALTLDYSKLKSTSILSLDGTEEKEIECASAGMVTLSYKKKFKYNTCNEKGYKITISSLKGGHSGGDIHLNRANANKLMAILLEKLNYPIISNIKGGDKDNAIPHTCMVEIVYNDKKRLLETIEKLKQYVNENHEEDTNIKIEVKSSKIHNTLPKTISKKIIELFNEIKNGVLEVNDDNFPLTSLNLASVNIDKEIEIKLSLRSSIKEYEKKYLDYLEMVADKYGYDFIIRNSAPFFEENKNSKLVKLCKETYKKLYKEEIKATPVHAGLEGGVFAQNIKDVDICVIAVNLYDIHSTTERVSISSIERVEKWVEEIVSNF